MCIALLNVSSPRDIHLQLALSIIKSLTLRNRRITVQELRFNVRVGIHAQTDHLVKDINGNKNLAGAGINKAFRIMDLADERQILVSDTVHEDLSSMGKYRDSFTSYSAMVRHGVTLDVHQFTGAGVDAETPDDIENQRRTKLIEERIIMPSTALGLLKVYASREEQVGRDALGDIEKAKKRVWLLGVSLHQPKDLRISDAEFVDNLAAKVGKHQDFDLKILLLDGFRSPAVFGALFESAEEESERIVKFRRRVPSGNDPYFGHPMFHRFRNAYEQLYDERNKSKFEAAVRFYGHIPTCWMVVADDTAYYQPYTLSVRGGEPHKARPANPLPVIKLRGQTKLFRALEEHFEKLWFTSDVDLFHTGARLIAKDKTIWHTFEKRKGGRWFESVHEILWNKESPGRDRRTYPRQRCITNLVAHIKWNKGKGPVTKTKIVDFSLQGLLVRSLDPPADAEWFDGLPRHHRSARKKHYVNIKIEPEGGWEKTKSKDWGRARGIPDIPAAKHLVDKMQRPTGGKFRYVGQCQKGEDKHLLSFQVFDW
jgi:hypothetical protein